MAIARIQITCTDCETEFWAKKECRNRAEANSWENWVRQNGRQCPDCYAKAVAAAREAERAAKSAENAEKAAGCPISLPELQGSEKQVKWANDIRNAALAQLEKYGIKWADFIAQAATDADIKVDLDKLMQPAAKWWIDNRGTKILGVVTIR